MRSDVKVESKAYRLVLNEIAGKDTHVIFDGGVAYVRAVVSRRELLMLRAQIDAAIGSPIVDIYKATLPGGTVRAEDVERVLAKHGLAIGEDDDRETIAWPSPLPSKEQGPNG